MLLKSDSQRLGTIRHRRVGGNGDRWNAVNRGLGMRPHTVDERVTILSRQADVGNDHRWPHPIERGEGIASRTEGGHRRPGILQYLHEQLSAVFVILEEQYGVTGQARRLSLLASAVACTNGGVG